MVYIIQFLLIPRSKFGMSRAVFQMSMSLNGKFINNYGGKHILKFPNGRKLFC